MRRFMSLIVGLAALAMPGLIPAAVVVDSFSSGSFTLQSTVAMSNTTTVSCGATCLGTHRDVLIAHNTGAIQAFVQNPFPPFEAQSVIPNGGGRLQFTYTAPGAGGVDLTSGGLGTDLWVHFSAFAAGAGARVTLADVNGNVAASSQSPTGPGLAIYPLSGFAGVDLSQIQTVELRIDSPDVGDYHVNDIRVPDPNGMQSTKAVQFSPGATTVTTGDVGRYPSDPAIQILSERAFYPFLTTTLRLNDVTGFDAGGVAVQVPASIVFDPAPADNGVVGFTTMLEAFPPDPIAIMQRFEFMDPGDPSSIHAHKVRTDWEPGRKNFSALAEIGKAKNDPGTYQHMLFVEVPPAQPGIITNVTAVPGSMDLNVQMSGVDANQPVLYSVMSGTFTPASTIPTASSAGLVVLAALVLVLGAGLVMMRKRGSAGEA